MLHLKVPNIEVYDDKTNKFNTVKGTTLQLEHSLVSLSKWEAKWNKPFLSKDEKTPEEIKDYIRFMTITQNVDPDIFTHLPNKYIQEINNYIESSMTATWFSDKQDPKKSTEVITAEIIYYWMIVQNIPIEFQKWHLNRLMTLIRVCSIKNKEAEDNAKYKGKHKRPNRQALASRHAINEARKAELNSKG